MWPLSSNRLSVSFLSNHTKSFAKFASLLFTLVNRMVQDTHLQMSPRESAEFGEDKLFSFISHFVHKDVSSIFDRQQQTALKSNMNFYFYFSKGLRLLLRK